MFVLTQPLSSEEYFNISNEWEFSDSYVTCVGFQFLCPEVPWVTDFKKISQTATNCIVGLPLVIDSGEKVESEIILEYLSGTDLATVPSVAFSRLKTHGKWVSSEVISWYACCLSQKTSITNCRIHAAEFGRIMFHGTVPDTTKEKLKTIVRLDDGLHRACFPCMTNAHWTLTSFERSPNGSGRLCFIDSLDIFEDDIREKFQEFFSDREVGKCEKLYLCQLGGGLQKNNITECGIFCMQNMDAIIHMKPFFKSSTWDSAANQRTLDGCKHARNYYASRLRQHCVLFFRHGTPVSLAAPEQMQPARVVPSDKTIVDLTTSDDDVDIPAKRSEKKETVNASEADTSKPIEVTVITSSDDDIPPKQSNKKKTVNASEADTSKPAAPEFCRTCDVPLGKGLCAACFKYQPPILTHKRRSCPASKYHEVDKVCALSALLSQCALTFHSRLSNLLSRPALNMLE
jgi:hypothetical protein